ncbi:MAG: hypothetical protein ACUVQY_01470 [Thermoproteota archaeon]
MVEGRLVTSEEMDDAFDWLILVISAINGILIGLPGTFEGRRIVAGWLIPPFFVLIAVWLLSRLIKRQHIKVGLKSYAWLYALLMITFFIMIFIDIIYGLLRKLTVFAVFPPLAIPYTALVYSGPFIFFDPLIRPVYKEAYKDSRLLTSRKQLILLYILTTMTIVILLLPFFLAEGKFPE